MATRYGDGLDRGKMRALYDSSPIAKRLLDALAAGSPAFASAFTVDGTINLLFEVTVDQTIKVANCGRSDAVDVLRKFADCGCGRFIHGRYGNPSRLKSEYNLLGVARQVVKPLPGA